MGAGRGRRVSAWGSCICRAGWILSLLLALPELGGWVAQAQAESAQNSASDEVDGGRHDAAMRFSAPVREALAQVHDRWLLLNSAVLRGDEALAGRATADLVGSLHQLGFERAPDLATALAAQGLQGVQAGQDARSALAFSLAEELDSRSHSLQFALARAAWMRGRYPSSIAHSVQGYVRALSEPTLQRLALRNVLIWLLLALLLSSVAFVALQVVTKGPRLLRDLSRRAPLPSLAALGVIASLLAVPMLLPSGWMWASLIYAVLLWGYGSQSERWVLAACLLILGLVPTAFSLLAYDQTSVPDPRLRFIDAVETRALYGGFVEDLAVVEASAGDDPALLHLLADVHLGLGQDEVARPFYQRVADLEPLNGLALNNLGVFHARRKEYVAAIEFLQSAADLEESRTAAGYNLSRIYDSLLEFGNSQRYLRLAREASQQQVGEWEQEGRDEVKTQGGVDRIDELRARRLRGSLPARGDLFQVAEPVVLSAAALLMAIVLPWLGFGSGAWSAGSGGSGGKLSSWIRALLPGLRSAEAGDGGRAFLAVLLPVSALLWVVSGAFAYPMDWGIAPGGQVVTICTVLALGVLFGLRVGMR